MGAPKPAKPKAVKLEQVFGSYARSLLWIALTFAVILSCSNITELIFVDFVHLNPNRTQENAFEMMLIFSPISAIIAIVGCFSVFILPQLAQAILHAQTLLSSRSVTYLSFMLFLPVISILTWYCWEYLTPTDFNLGINEGADWKPYQHGISLRRYMGALAFQTPVTFYSLLYCEPRMVMASRRTIVIYGIAAAILIGIGYGRFLAEQHYKFVGLNYLINIKHLANIV